MAVERSRAELKPTGAPAQRTGQDEFSDFVLGQPAPRTLYLVMDVDSGIENEVTDEQPERGHVLVVAGEQVLIHHLDRMDRSGQLTPEEESRQLAAAEPGAAVSGATAKTAADKEAADVDATDAALEHAKASGVDIGAIKGTGSGGRVTKGDVEKAIQAKGEQGAQP